MPASPSPRSLRLTAIGCGLAFLLVIHISMRYLIGTLFGFAEYRGLSPVIPFLALGVYVLLLGGVAVSAIARRELAGLSLGTGLLILAVEPIASSFLWGDGCEVSAGAGASLLPEILVRQMGRVIVLFTWNGSCSVSLTTPVIGIGVAFVGIGLWAGEILDNFVARWVALLERYLTHNH